MCQKSISVHQSEPRRVKKKCQDSLTVSEKYLNSECQVHRLYTHTEQRSRFIFPHLINTSKLRAIVFMRTAGDARLSFPIGYCCAFFFSLSKRAPGRLRALQDAAATLLTRSYRWSHYLCPFTGSQLYSGSSLKLSTSHTEHQHFTLFIYCVASFLNSSVCFMENFLFCCYFQFSFRDIQVCIQWGICCYL